MTNKATTCIYNSVYNTIDTTASFLPFKLKDAISYGFTYLSSDLIIKDIFIRIDYESKVNEIHTKYVEKLNSNEEITEEFALELFNARNDIKSIEKSKMSFYELYFLQARNYFKYNNFDGPDFDYFINKGKSYAEIAESSGRTGGEDLGLKSELYECVSSELKYYDDLAGFINLVVDSNIIYYHSH